MGLLKHVALLSLKLCTESKTTNFGALCLGAEADPGLPRPAEGAAV